MDSLILACSFGAALALAACVVLLFSRSIDEVLTPVIPAEAAAAWSRCVKFVLFTATMVGGLRLSDLANVLLQRTPSGESSLTAGQGLLEVYRTIAGALVTASATSLSFFAATLALDAAGRAYRSYRAAAEKEASKPRPVERPAVGAERHAGRERQAGAPPRPVDIPL
jgi:hypothetical protein